MIVAPSFFIHGSISRARIAGRGASGKPLTSWRRSKLSSHCLTSAGASFGASAVISPPNDHAPSRRTRARR